MREVFFWIHQRLKDSIKDKHILSVNQNMDYIKSNYKQFFQNVWFKDLPLFLSK